MGTKDFQQPRGPRAAPSWLQPLLISQPHSSPSAPGPQQNTQETLWRPKGRARQGAWQGRRRGGGIHRGSGLRERLYHTPQPERVPTKLPALT